MFSFSELFLTQCNWILLSQYGARFCVNCQQICENQYVKVPQIGLQFPRGVLNYVTIIWIGSLGYCNFSKIYFLELNKITVLP